MFFLDEFSKLKEEIPEELITAHIEKAKSEIENEEKKSEGFFLFLFNVIFILNSNDLYIEHPNDLRTFGCL